MCEGDGECVVSIPVSSWFESTTVTTSPDTTSG